MKVKSIPKVVIFSIITLGIYYLYWICVTTNAIQKSLKKPDGSVSNGGLAVLFSIITCGVYSIYWWYRQGQRMVTLGKERGEELIDNSLVYIIVALVGFSLVNAALMQLDINKLAGAAQAPEKQEAQEEAKAEELIDNV